MDDTPNSAARRFTFDTVFDGDRVVAPPRPKIAFSAAEVAAARAGGFAEGQASAVARSTAEASAALVAAQREIHAALAALKALAHEHRVAAAELALACGRAIADAALARAPVAVAEAALTALAREIEAQPRLTVRASVAQEDHLRAALTQAADAAGFAGQVIVRADPGLAPAAFSFDWGEGRARFDPDEAAARVVEAVASALAAEALHAEAPLLDLAS